MVGELCRCGRHLCSDQAIKEVDPEPSKEGKEHHPLSKRYGDQSCSEDNQDIGHDAHRLSIAGGGHVSGRVGQRCGGLMGGDGVCVHEDNLVYGGVDGARVCTMRVIRQSDSLLGYAS